MSFQTNFYYTLMCSQSSFEYSLLFWHNQVFLTYYYFSLPGRGIICFSKKLWFLLVDKGIQKPTSGFSMYSLLLEYCFPSGQRQSTYVCRKCIYAHTPHTHIKIHILCTDTFTSITTSMSLHVFIYPYVQKIPRNNINTSNFKPILWGSFQFPLFPCL